LYPDYNIVEYRITDLPKNFGDRLFRDTAHMILYVINFQNEEEAKRTTEEMVRLLNKAYGKEV
jgi:hypothetical protein